MLTDEPLGYSDAYYLAMAALDRYEKLVPNDGLPKSTSVEFRIHQLGHEVERLQKAMDDYYKCEICGLSHSPGRYYGNGVSGWAECHYYKENERLQTELDAWKNYKVVKT